VSYFVKVTQNKFGRKMFRGEYEANKAIYEACPDFCPRPIAWGVYESVPNTYFFLSSFIDMVDDLPDLHRFPQKVAQMHKKAMAPDGKYGFHVQDMCALLPMYVTKSSSWETFFQEYMRHFMAAEKLAQGTASEDMKRLEGVTLNRIIPRLCRPLETGGREIEPRLLHSDLWDGNAAIDAETENPIVFDSSCFYGHNECKQHSAKYASRLKLTKCSRTWSLEVSAT
jgi:fructosamine-3-kinase